eukprot:169346-Chlamydomonas_euryale.AAC.8
MAASVASFIGCCAFVGLFKGWASKEGPARPLSTLGAELGEMMSAFRRRIFGPGSFWQLVATSPTRLAICTSIAPLLWRARCFWKYRSAHLTRARRVLQARSRRWSACISIPFLISRPHPLPHWRPEAPHATVSKLKTPPPPPFASSAPFPFKARSANVCQVAAPRAVPRLRRSPQACFARRGRRVPAGVSAAGARGGASTPATTFFTFECVGGRLQAGSPGGCEWVCAGCVSSTFRAPPAPLRRDVRRAPHGGARPVTCSAGKRAGDKAVRRTNRRRCRRGRCRGCRART